ncbi:MAG: hypothetical protein ACLQDY_31885 [Streptosporangiaceae bacterium]
MAIVFFVITAVTVSVPLAAAGLVSLASRSEDHAWTLGGPAPGPGRAAARRIVGFHSQGFQGQQPTGSARARGEHIRPPALHLPTAARDAGTDRGVLRPREGGPQLGGAS